jgi:hypothetical protein
MNRQQQTNRRRIAVLAYLSFDKVITTETIATLLDTKIRNVHGDKMFFRKHGLADKTGLRGSQSYDLTELGEECLEYETMDFL